MVHFALTCLVVFGTRLDKALAVQARQQKFWLRTARLFIVLLVFNLLAYWSLWRIFAANEEVDLFVIWLTLLSLANIAIIWNYFEIGIGIFKTMFRKSPNDRLELPPAGQEPPLPGFDLDRQ